jgi:NitT/TauT family transport system permease protein
MPSPTSINPASTDPAEIEPTAALRTRNVDSASVEAGLDALESTTVEHEPWLRLVAKRALPPIAAVLTVLLVWQILCWLQVKPDYVLPTPKEVWDTFVGAFHSGAAQRAVYNSVKRAVIGFTASVIIATPLGLLLARVKTLRFAVGPILSGLQSLPSVAWVPAAVLWFGITNQAIYAVVLLGAIPSIANGLISGMDQVPAIYPQVGRVLGARRLDMVRFVLLPAAAPGYVAGLKQGWAFAWRSLMAAELIAASPALGLGLGQLLDSGRALADMSIVFTAIILILIVGIAVDVLFFAPIERRMLRQRGLAGARR